MGFLDDVTSTVMTQLQQGYLDGTGAAKTFLGNLVVGQSEDRLAALLTDNVYLSAVALDDIDAVLNSTGSPSEYPGLKDNERDEALTAIALFFPVWRPVTVTTAETDRMEAHVTHVNKNLPTIQKKAGTVNALRDSTTTISSNNPPVPSTCNRDGNIISEITGTPKIPSASAMGDMAGTATGAGDVLQQGAYTASDNVIGAIDPTFSVDLKDELQLLLALIQDEVNSELGNADIAGSIGRLNIKSTAMVLTSWYSDADVAVADLETKNTAINNKVTEERVNAGLPDTDGSELTLNGVTVPAGSPSVLQISAGAATAETKKLVAGLAAVPMGNDPCMAEIAARNGAPEIQASAASNIVVGAMVTTVDVVKEPDLVAAQEDEEVLSAANDNIIEDQKAALNLQLDAVTWASPSVEILFAQLRGTNSAITIGIDFDIPGSPGESFTASYLIPSSIIIAPESASGYIERLRLPGPGTEPNVAILTSFVDEIKNGAGAAVVSANSIKVWAFVSPSTGVSSIVIFGPKDLTFTVTPFMTIGEFDCTDTECAVTLYELTSGNARREEHDKQREGVSGSSLTVWLGVYEHNAISYIRDFMNGLETEDELDAFETNVLGGIAP